MIHFYYGDNDYRIDQAVAKVSNGFIGKFGKADVTNIDVASTDTADIMDQLTAMSLFSANRLVVVKQFTDNADNWLSLERVIPQIADGTEVVLTDSKITGKVKNLTRTKTYKALQKANADIQKMDMLKSFDVRPWLNDEIKRRKLDFQTPAINYLIQQTSGDDNQQARLMIELNKLALLAIPITTQIIDEYVEPSPAINSFNIFTDAITDNKQRAIAEVRRLALTDDANKFLGLLASQEYALSVAVFGGQAKINPYQLRKSQELANRIGSRSEQMVRMRRIATILAKLDGEIKLSRPDEAWLRIEAAIASL